MDKQKPSELEIALQTIEHLKNRIEVLEKGRAEDLEQILKVNEQLKKESIIALRESEEKYRELFEMESDAIFLIENSTGSILEVNQAASVLYGYSREELLQKRNTDLSVETEATRAATQERRTSVPVRYHKKKDGIVFPVEITARHFSWQGREVHIAAIRDITDRKRAEEALRDSEFKFRTLFDSSPQAIALTEFQTGKLVDVNVKFCELTKYAAEEIMGRTTTECEFYSEADRARFIDEFQATGEVLGLEMDFRTKDGSTLHTQMFSRVLQIGNEELLLTMFVDMTEQKRLEVQLQQAQKMEAIGTLAGGIAHDFNNLLMGIQGNVSLMLLNMDPTHQYYERLKNVEKQVESGARLTSHLLGYARKGKYEVKPVDLNQLVEETCETFGRTRKQVDIHRDLAGDLSAIEADSGQIEQVLLNLLVNAADAMPGGGDLILKTMNVTHKDMTGKLYKPKRGDYVMLTVTDSGTGMDKKTMERIFDPFFTTKEMGRGTGLGLASAYGIMKAHGGYIDVESKKGQGTTFSIYLRASEKEVHKAVKTAEEVIEGTGKVLLVDDEEVILEVGQDLLEAMGYRVLIARDGNEAIEVYKKNRDEIEIVVLDMVMPGMGGGEAYDRMKEVNPDIKVVLSSGFSIDGEATEILERGCDGFIQKPFRMNELAKKIREILDKK
jgi:PAS domain S-box-containing protein